MARCDLQKIPPDSAAREQGLAFGPGERIGIAFADQDAGGDLLGLAVPIPKGLGVLLREARHIGEGLVEVAAEDQRGAVLVGLAEFVWRRDVLDAIPKAQIMEPGGLGNVKVIDGVEVVIEARLCRLLGAEPAAVIEPPLHQQNLQARPRQIAAEHQTMVSRANDDSVVIALKSPGHGVPLIWDRVHGRSLEWFGQTSLSPKVSSSDDQRALRRPARVLWRWPP